MIPCEIHPTVEAVLRRGYDNAWLCENCFAKVGDFTLTGPLRKRRKIALVTAKKLILCLCGHLSDSHLDGLCELCVCEKFLGVQYKKKTTKRKNIAKKKVKKRK